MAAAKPLFSGVGRSSTAAAEHLGAVNKAAAEQLSLGLLM